MPGALRLDEAEEAAAVDAVRDVMRSRRLFRHGGVTANPLERSRVAALERAFARTIGSGHALAVNSGTSALVCALAGLEVGEGDEVIVPGYTWVSTLTAVMALGAVPVVAEVDESLTLDVDHARGLVSPRTRALVPVHMRGAPADMDAVGALGREHGLRVLEDAAQAAGASFRGRRLGSIGDAGAFSFHMAKMITAGEGGMVTTGDAAVHRRAAMYHDAAAMPHRGVSADEWRPGLNLRMSELQGAVVGVQLDRLDGLLADARARKSRLRGIVEPRLRELGVTMRSLHDPEGEAGIALVFFMPEPEGAAAAVTALEHDNVPASRLYKDGADLPHDYVDLHAYPAWTPIHRRFGYAPDALPRTTALLRRAVHVDVSPDLSEEQVEQMAGAIVAAAERLA